MRSRYHQGREVCIIGHGKRTFGGIRRWWWGVVSLILVFGMVGVSVTTAAADEVNAAEPTISDTTPTVDQVLTADPGTWGPAPVSLLYRWYKVHSNGEATSIAGATSAQYRTKTDDIGYRLGVSVIGSKSGHTTTFMASDETETVAKGTFANPPKPTISGTAKVGKTLKADPGTLEPGASYSFEWYRGKKAISGATKKTYKTTLSDQGKTLSVRVTASKTGYESVSEDSEPTKEVPEVPAELRVATFNISGQNNDPKAKGDRKVWSKRLPVVASQIIGENSDVVGLQEAYQRTKQYVSLRNALNARGESYQVTDLAEGTSAGTRILYNTKTVTPLDKGSKAYASQVGGKTDRYLVWAKFRHNASGKKFFFFNTHLSPDSSSVRVKEWKELISKVTVLNDDNLPVVVVGDFNTSKHKPAAAQMLPAMKNAGFGDVMNQQYKVNPPVNPRAESVVNGAINSFNDYRRGISAYSYPLGQSMVGNGIDWIFATNSLRVKEWKVVINVDPSTRQIRGVIPSDHNMISSVIVI